MFYVHYAVTTSTPKCVPTSQLWHHDINTSTKPLKAHNFKNWSTFHIQTELVKTYMY